MEREERERKRGGENDRRKKEKRRKRRRRKYGTRGKKTRERSESVRKGVTE